MQNKPRGCGGSCGKCSEATQLLPPAGGWELPMVGGLPSNSLIMSDKPSSQNVINSFSSLAVPAPSTSVPSTSSAGSTSTRAATYDAGKAPLAWLPWAAIEAMSRVQLYGHSKYKDFNNYRKGMEVSRNLSCALRHIKEYMEGHDLDAESGIHPLAHAMCRIAFVLQNLHDNVAVDDRYVRAMGGLPSCALPEGPRK